MTYVHTYAALLLCSSYLIGYESLPKSVNAGAVYYVKTQQLDDFSCSYNALFNACNVDKSCGISNGFSDYGPFSQVSMAYVKSHGLKPKGSASTNDTDELAVKYLKMKNTCNLGFDDKKIIPLLHWHAQITLTGRESKAEQEKMFEREFDRQRQEFFEKIKQQFDSAGGLTRVMHFICTVQDGRTGHAVLVSLVQNETGRGLYIFDNLNRKISENSQIMRYVHHLSTRYNVSSRDVFKGPQLPDRWPTLPKPRYEYYYN